MILFLLVITKWYFVLAAASLAGLGIIYIHDRLNYGPLIIKDNEDM